MYCEYAHQVIYYNCEKIKDLQVNPSCNSIVFKSLIYKLNLKAYCAVLRNNLIYLKWVKEFVTLVFFAISMVRIAAGDKQKWNKDLKDGKAPNS